MNQDNQNNGGLFGAAHGASTTNNRAALGTPLLSPTNDVNAALARQIGQQEANINEVLSGIGNIQHDSTHPDDLSDAASTNEREQELRRNLAASVSREAALGIQFNELKEMFRASQAQMKTLEAELANAKTTAATTNATAAASQQQAPASSSATSVSQVYTSPGRIRKPAARRSAINDARKAAVDQFRKTSDPATTATGQVKNTVTHIEINGELIELLPAPLPVKSQRRRLWDKVKRKDLSTDDYIAWEEKATKHVLTKHNKLAIPDCEPTKPKCLEAIRNPGLQLQQLEEHMHQHDIDDVMTIVQPKDLLNTIECEKESYNLFRDYHQLSLEHVANSCAWYNSWTSENWPGRKHMNVIFELLRKNTEDGLWNKALDECNAYELPHKGGTLMFAIILKRQIKSNEVAMTSLASNLVKIRIRDEPGEDVETTCARIKAGYEALQNASGEGYNCVPSDFNKNILNLFRTSSVGRFNKVFNYMHTTITSQAALNQTLPQWEEVPAILRLATAWYNNIKDDSSQGGLNVPTNQKKKALTANSEGKGGGDFNSSNSQSESDITCFNCGEKGHRANQRDKCSLPYNAQRVNAEHAKLKEKKEKGARSSVNNVNTKKTKSIDGKPHVLNKKGKWVPDQKAIYLAKKKEEDKTGKNELMEMTKNLCAAISSSGDDKEDSKSEPAKPAKGSQEQAAALQARMKEVFQM